MNKLLVVCIVMCLVPLATAELDVELKTADGEVLSDVVVTLAIGNTTITQFIEKDTNLKVDNQYTGQTARIVVDDRTTEGKDYMGVSSIKDSIIVTRVGSVRGIVKDKFDNVISFAELQFDCPFSYDFPATTDKFGSFSLDTVPLGNCRVIAGFKGTVGVQQIAIERGALVDVELKLNKSIISERQNSPLMFIVGGIAVLLVAAVLFYFILFPSKKEVRNIVKKAKFTQQELGKRGRDVYKTLRTREKNVVDFLLAHPGHTVQSKIHRELGIAKSSLFRTIEALENKNVIETTKTAKARRIKLSDWFLEKE